MNDSQCAKFARTFNDPTWHEATDAIGRAMRLRDYSEPPSGRIGQTKLYLNNCDTALAGDVAYRLQRFYDDFPHVAAKLREVNVLDLPNGCYAGTAGWDNGRFHISLNRAAYARGRRAFLEEHVAEDYAKGFHRFDTPGGPFEHELGHVLDMSMGLPGAKSIEYGDAHAISGYAQAGGPEEAFADAFANYREGVRNSSYVDDVVAGVMRAAANPPRRWGWAA